MAEELAHRIEAEVMASGWPIGSLFGSETELIARYGVSRAVFREAVRLVEHHGVATMRRGAKGGLIITVPDARAVQRPALLYLDWAGVDAAQIVDARRALELDALALAVRRLDDAGIARLQDALAAEAAALGTEDARDLLHELHLVIGELSGNVALQLFIETLARLLVAKVAGIPYDDADVREAHAEHVAIVEAMIDGDVELARLHMSRHLTVATTTFVGAPGS